MTEKPSSDADKSIQGVPAESKFPNVLRLPTISAKLNEPRLVEKKVGLGQVAPVPELNFFSCDIPAPELMVLAISDISVGEQILPVNAPTVEAFKESFSIERQVVPILVRKHQDGHFELLSGIAEIQALSELGQTEVLATVVSGLTDLDARFLEVTSSIHPKLSVLDRTLLHDRLEAVMKETKASQHETAVQTNRDLSVRKIAEHFGFKKDMVLRSRKMARIHPDVHRDIREAKFDNNQKALLGISDAGATAAEQLAKLRELSERRSRGKQNRAKPKKNGIAPLVALIADREMRRDERANEMPDVPAFLRRNSANYDQAKSEWSRCRDIVLALDPEDRQRFFNECVLPIVHTGPSVGAPTAKMLPVSGGSGQ